MPAKEKVKHTCHAFDCNVSVPPEMFMCRSHWFKVSPATRKAIWRHYRAGQCDDKRPSIEWLEAARQAMVEVCEKEGKYVPMMYVEPLIDQ